MIYRLLSLCRRFGRLVAVGLVAAAIVAVAATSPWASRATTAPERSESNAKLPGVSQPITKPQPPDPERAPASRGSDSPAEGNKPTFTGPRQRQRGVALGLFAEDTSFSYGPLLAEIAALGASHVALVVPIYQQHGESTSLYLHTRFSPTLDAVAEAVRLARQQRLEVTLFPIVRLEAPRTAQEWRGTLAPADPAMWFASYGEILGSLAALGSLTGATRLVIGSELSTLDNLTASWAPLLERIRAVFAGTLVYSANWDHFQDAALLDLVDEAGITGYFALRQVGEPPNLEALTERWRQLRKQLEGWARRRQQPWLFTELGYRSRTNSTASPWDETPGGQPDPAEQVRGFEAFARAWGDGATLSGLYIWNWYGYGAATTTSYTPRGKPATEVVRRLLSEF